MLCSYRARIVVKRYVYHLMFLTEAHPYLLSVFDRTQEKRAVKTFTTSSHIFNATTITPSGNAYHHITTPSPSFFHAVPSMNMYPSKLLFTLAHTSLPTRACGPRVEKFAKCGVSSELGRPREGKRGVLRMQGAIAPPLY